MESVGAPRGGGFDWEEAEDLTAASARDLRERLEALCEEERALDYRVHVLRGRIDLVRAELVRRGLLAALPPEGLARVLLGDADDGDRP